VVVGNSGCHDPAPTLACWPVHAQAPRVESFSRTKGNPRSTQVSSCGYVALAHRSCSGCLGPRSHRCWRQFGRTDSLSDHNCDFTCSECCDLCGNWIDSLDFRGSIFPFLSTALARLVRLQLNPCQLPISRITGHVPASTEAHADCILRSFSAHNEPNCDSIQSRF
jgi:hypothetical protein